MPPSVPARLDLSNDHEKRISVEFTFSSQTIACFLKKSLQEKFKNMGQQLEEKTFFLQVTYHLLINIFIIYEILFPNIKTSDHVSIVYMNKCIYFIRVTQTIEQLC